MASQHTHTQRLAIRVYGRVQGVGFRPFVYRLATQLHLAGHVGNDAEGVFIEIEGSPSDIQIFLDQLPFEAPPLARIQNIQSRSLPPTDETAFRIVSSIASPRPVAQVAPDTATCPDCLREIRDPSDRRHKYPFINCTNCGPRYSIVASVPYDRPNTTMRAFAMCDACRREYENPADRRFHAQPVACPECGPRVWLAKRNGSEVPGDAITEAAKRILAGAIVAVKGLGGFHLACRADTDEAVSALRDRKGRDAKPFALMVDSLETARTLCRLNPKAEALLQSPEAPIVLALRRPDAPISPHVAPGNAALGVMLPYTPLHHLLFDCGLAPLVMTSGNPSEEPLCHDNDGALRRLAPLADAFLLHNRPIQRPIDDSVVIALDNPSPAAPAVVPIRRARGYVPAPIPLSPPAPRPVLALGAELKSTLCFARDAQAILSEHLGELTNPAACRHFLDAIDRLAALLEIEPQVVACDLHPAYAATRHAREIAPDPVAVQHHHAHIAAVMAEHGLDEPVVGIAIDGTGYGNDGTIWGCEILVCELAEATRAAHLQTYPLPGGDAAARETWRPAAALLALAWGADWRERANALFDHVDPAALDMVEALLANHASGKRPIPPGLTTSSLGRLFDSVAFLLGICHTNTFEARAAMALEAAAMKTSHGEVAAFEIVRTEEGAPIRIDPAPVIRDIAKRSIRGESVSALARGFHEAASDALAQVAAHVAKSRGIERITLSGGCMANRLLAHGLWQRLQDADFDVRTHRETPVGDGAIALGQAVVAAARDRLGLVGAGAEPRKRKDL